MSKSGDDPDGVYEFVRKYGLLGSVVGIVLLILQSVDSFPEPVQVSLDVAGLVFIVIAGLTIATFIFSSRDDSK